MILHRVILIMLAVISIWLVLRELSMAVSTGKE
jgi:hypothetical protein